MHGESPRLGPFPKDPTGTQKRPFINGRALVLKRFQDGHVERKHAHLGVLVKLFERPLLYGLFENPEPLRSKEAKLGCFSRTDVSIYDHFHL